MYSKSGGKCENRIFDDIPVARPTQADIAPLYSSFGGHDINKIIGRNTNIKKSVTEKKDRNIPKAEVSTIFVKPGNNLFKRVVSP